MLEDEQPAPLSQSVRDGGSADMSLDVVGHGAHCLGITA